MSHLAPEVGFNRIGVEALGELLATRVLQRAPVAIVVLDPCGRVQYGNALFERATGCRLDEVRGRDWLDLLLPGIDRRAIGSWLEQVQGGQVACSAAPPIVTSARDGRQIEWIAESLGDETGSAAEVVLVGRDVSGRVATPADATPPLREFLESLPAMVGILAPDGTLLDVNRRPLEVFGFSREEVIGRSVVGLYPWVALPPDEQEKFADSLRRAARGEFVRYDVDLPTPNGGSMTVDFWITPIKDASGKVTHLVPVGLDVSARKRVESDLLTTQRRLSQALDATVEGIWEWDLRAGEIFYSPRWIASLGYSPEEVPADAWFFITLTHPDDVVVLGEALRDYLTGRKAAFACEIRLRTKSGAYRPMLHRGMIVEQDEAGCPIRMLGADTDVTERKIAQAHVAESHRVAMESARRLDLLAANVPVVLWEAAVTKDGLAWTWVSQNANRILGVSAEKLIGTADWQSHAHPDDLADHGRWGPVLGASGDRWVDRFRWIRPDGAVVHLQVGVSVVGESGGSLALVGFALDVTDRVRIEEELQAGLRAKETLLREVHHRVKNSLQIVASLLALQSSVLADPIAREALRESIHRVNAMGLIHERLYRSKALAYVELSEYARELTEFLIRAYRVSRPPTLVVDGDPCMIRIETAVTCGLILNELVCNALRHGVGNDETGELRVSVRAEPDGGYRLTVQDSGAGLPPGFDVEQQRSLGLRLVLALVKQLKGTLTVRDEGGASFSVAFMEHPHEP